jgi:hypothetical protein
VPALAEAFGRDYSSDNGKYEIQSQIVAKNVDLHAQRGVTWGKRSRGLAFGPDGAAV